MKTLASKFEFLIICFILVQLQTFAQTTIAELKDGSINKAITQSYLVKKPSKYIDIEDINNKFTNIKQHSPKLLGSQLGWPDIIFDNAKLRKICAKYISKQQLEILAAGEKYASIMINIRTDINGNTLEVGFFTKQNSILNLNQLELIEQEIKTTKLVSMKPAILPLLEGSNYILVWPSVHFEDMLKVKLEIERPQQREIH
jgi:hypothetical protein